MFLARREPGLAVVRDDLSSYAAAVNPFETVDPGRFLGVYPAIPEPSTLLLLGIGAIAPNYWLDNCLATARRLQNGEVDEVD